MYTETRSLGESQEETMGRPELPGLCILGRRYREWVRG